MNKGLAFEWCIYHLVAQTYPKQFFNDSVAKTAKLNFNNSPLDVKKSANFAIGLIEKDHGKIIDIEKTSGGKVEPKTDLLVTTKRTKLKCSLKYGGSIQLSSGGISTTVKVLTGILNNLKKQKNYNSKQITSIMSVLAELDDKYGDLGKLPRKQIDGYLGKSEKYNNLLQQILGSSRVPSVSSEYNNIKLAIIEEAMTGKFAFGEKSKLSSDYILSEKKLQKIDKKLIQIVADKTSVRIALKGRGIGMVAGKEVRLNEIVIRFDTKT